MSETVPGMIILLTENSLRFFEFLENKDYFSFKALKFVQSYSIIIHDLIKIQQKTLKEVMQDDYARYAF